MRIFVFEQKLARNTLFLSKDIIVLDSDQVSCLVPTVLHLSTAKSEHFEFNILKQLQIFVRVKENFALELKKIYIMTPSDSPKLILQ